MITLDNTAVEKKSRSQAAVLDRPGREIDPDAKEFSQWAGDHSVKANAPESTMFENLKAGWEKDFEEDQTTSFFQLEGGDMYSQQYGWMVTEREAHEMRRARHIENLIDQGRISQDDVARSKVEIRGFGDKTNYDEIARYVNDNNILDDQKLPTDVDFLVAQEKRLKDEREARNKIFESASFAGDVASFIGGAASSIRDPVSLATLPLAVPMTGIVATSRLAYALSVAGREAALNMGLQAVVEPFVYNWKESLNLEYTVGDAMINMAAAGLFGGVVGLPQGAFAYKFAQKDLTSTDYNVLFKKYIDSGLTETDAEIAAIMKRELNAQILYAKDLPPEEFIRNVENEQIRLNGPDSLRGADVDNIDAAVVESQNNMSIDEYNALNNEFDTVDDNLLFHTNDGNVVPIKNLAFEDEARLTRVNEMRACLNG